MMTETWVREEAARQMVVHCPGGLVPSVPMLAESCLRAGLLEAVRQIELVQEAYGDPALPAALIIVRALAGEEPNHG